MERQQDNTAMTASAPATGSVSLSPQARLLASMLENPKHGVTTDAGYELRDGVWKAPASVPDDVRAVAAKHFERVKAMLDPAGDETKARWLSTLGTMTAGTMSVQDATVKLLAYGRLLKHGGGCFTEDSLERAGREFKWFPAFAEVAKFLDAEQSRINTRADRLRKIMKAPAPTPTLPKQDRRGWSDLSDEEKTAFDNRLRDLGYDPGEGIRGAGNPFPAWKWREMETPEDRAYIARMAAPTEARYCLARLAGKSVDEAWGEVSGG